MLMRRAERRRAERAGQTPRTLAEIDLLLMVNDAARQGALRFAERLGGPFLAAGGDSAIPPLVELSRLLSAAQHVSDEDDSDEDLRLLLAPGSSLGGARPKASVREVDGTLAIAKFPNDRDDRDVVRWEAVGLALAEKAGIEVPAWRLEIVGGKAVIVLRRFDRIGANRLPYLSAMSMLGARVGEGRSYLEIADALTASGASPRDDKQALWRRVVFNVLISNTDDHLRNHGFLYQGWDGWRLAPAFDLNPTPVDIKPRVLATAINEDDGTASLEIAMSVAGYFDLRIDEARKVVAEVGRAVSTWRDQAEKFGLKRPEMERTRSAFEHEDLAVACREI
jgi:serine/threonine-protein kinase HipA